MSLKLNKSTNKSYTGTFIKQNIKENKKILILLFILQLLGIPSLITLATIDEAFKDESHYISNDNLVIILLFFVASFAIAEFMGIVVAIKSFRHLHKKPVADVTLSLPLSSSQRFTGSYISGLLIYIVPYITAILITTAILPISGHVTSSSTVMLESCFLLYASIGLFTMIMLYTTVAFTCICCGKTFESAIYSILINIAVPLFVGLFNYAAYSNIPGLDPLEEATESLSLSATFGGVYRAIFSISNDVPFATGTIPFDLFAWFIKYIILIALLIAFSFFLYKKRKAEDISKPFVFSFIYYIFLVTTVTSILMFSTTNHLEIAGIVLSFIIYVTLDMIKTRGFKNPKKHALSLLCYCFSIIAAFSIVKISKETDGFGKKYYVPDVKNIRSVEFSSYGYETNIFCNYESSPQYKRTVNITDEKTIRQIVNAHQAGITYYDDLNSNAPYYSKYYSKELNTYENMSVYNSIDLYYTTKTGKTIYRYLALPTDELQEILLYMAEEEALRKQTADMFEEELTEYHDDILAYTDPYVYANTKFSSHKYDTQIKYTDTKKIKQLSEAYRKDIMSVTHENLLDMKTHCILLDKYYIPECFKNTIAILDENSSFSANSKYEYQFYDNPIIISSSSYIKDTCKTGHITISRKIPGQYLLTSYDLNLLYSVVDAAEPNYFTYDDCYIINLDYKNYIIPPEYSELAQKLIDSSEHIIIDWELI